MSARWIISLCLLCCPVLATAADKYIRATGGSGSACTFNSPCSITEGVNQMNGGDTLYLKNDGGTYFQGIGPETGLPEVPGGSSENNRTFIRPAPGQTVTVRFFDLSNQHWLTISGENRLIIDGEFNSEIGVIGAGAHVTLEDLEIKNVLNHGVLGCSGGSSEGQCIFRRLNIHHFGEDENGNNSCFGDNLCHGLYVVAPNILAENNHIHHYANGKGIHPNSGGLNTSGFIMRGNVFHDGAQAMLAISGSNYKIYNNIAYNMFSWCFEEFGSNGAGHQIYNNTCVNTDGIRSLGGGSNPDISRNNIVCGGGDAGTGIQSNNLFSCPTGTFVSAPGGDFHILSPGSPAVGGGTNLSSVFQTDKDGNSRPSSGAWTIGAFEFGGAPPPDPNPDPVGLVAEYLGNGNANDSSPGGFHGTLNNGALANITPAIVAGQMFRFDGVNDNFTAPNDVHFRMLKPNLAAWVKPAAAPVDACRVMSTGLGYAIGWSDDMLPFAWINNGQFTATGTTPLALNTTALLGMTYDGTVLRLWVNAANVASVNTGGTAVSYTGSEVLAVGGVTNRYCQADVDNVRVFDTEITAAGWQNIYLEVLPQVGMSITHTGWFATGAQGTQIGTTDTDLASWLMTMPIALRFAMRKSDSGSLTEYFRPWCITNTGAGFPAWTSAVELVNSFGALGIRYYADAAITQGEATSPLLPLDGATGAAGKVLENPIDTTVPYDAVQRITIAQGQQVEQQIQVEFGSPLVGGNSIQCRLRRENATDFDGGYGSVIKTLTLSAPVSSSTLAGGIREGGIRQ